MKRIIIIGSVLLSATCIKAQDEPTSVAQIESNRTSDLRSSVKGLKTGDKMPDIQLGKIINGNYKQASMSDFRGKLLLLDFMDTYCGACIGKLPEMNNLQKEFGDRLAIFPVTWEKQAYINKWLTNPKGWVMRQNVKLPWIVEDTLLRSYFKHKIVSHFAWIYDGKVKAITGTEYITAANIQTVLDGEEINWAEKKDEFYFDPKQPFFSLLNPESYSQKSNFTSYTGITGYREGIDYKDGIAAYDSVLNRTYFYNSSILDAYIGLWSKLMEPRVVFLKHPGRVILEVKNPERYVSNTTDFLNGVGKGNADIWNRQNKFCYEMVAAKPLEEKARIQRVINDLNNHFGLNGRVEKRAIKCLVLVQAPGGAKPDTARSAGNLSIEVRSIPFFFFDYTQKYPPALDETGYKGTISLNKGKGYDDTFDNLRAQLQAQGFDIIEANREIDVLVITEIKQ